MANEVNIDAQLTARKNNLSVNRRVTRVQADMTGEAYSANVQEIGTTYEPVTVSAGVSTPGYAFLRNLDDTHFIQVGLEVGGAFQPMLKLLPGQVALAPLATPSLYAQADTAAAQLETIVLAA